MSTLGPVVSSAHLAAGALPEMSELEFGLIMASNAFMRWTTRCMTAAGLEDMSSLEVLILHSVNHRGRPKKLADICLVLNIEDTHTVAYALKKLEKRRLVQGGKAGKEKTVEITTTGEAACVAYGKVREAMLIESIMDMGLDKTQMSRLSSLLRAMSGQYDQAARAAASM
ncbi:MAG: winged helix DNA-binding protein [Pseudomonadota bacterium]